MPCFYGIFTQCDKYYYIMANRNHKQLMALSKTFYGTENYLTLNTKQQALIKSVHKDTGQTEHKVSRPDNNTATESFLK